MEALSCRINYKEIRIKGKILYLLRPLSLLATEPRSLEKGTASPG